LWARVWESLATVENFRYDSNVTEERTGMTTHVSVGDRAPLFSLPGTTGPGLDLSAIRGKSRAALFFYPVDRTAG
jgi:hypothetical protein